MKIEITNVSFEQPEGKRYRVAVVKYQRNGRETTWRLMPFGDSKSAYETIVAKPVGWYDITTDKNAGGYTNWVKAVATEASPVAVAHTSPKSNYETTEERASRQSLIVRQSCLSNAIALLTLKGDKKSDKEAVVDLAEYFYKYVYGGTAAVVGEALSDEAAYQKMMEMEQAA